MTVFEEGMVAITAFGAHRFRVPTETVRDGTRTHVAQSGAEADDSLQRIIAI
jgi:hypothetical protein